MLPADPSTELKRLKAALDAQQPPRTDPMIVPSWAGSSGGSEAEIRISFVDGRVCVAVSDAFRELVRKAAFRP